MERGTEASRWSRIANRATIAFLIGCVLALIPPAILPDLIVPFEGWYELERERVGRPKAFTLDHLPPVLAAEIAVFKYLAFPPSWVAERFGASRTQYASLAVPSQLHTEATHPPFVFTMQHLRLAVPFWWLVVFLLIQLLSLVRRKVV
jgi:hypothetical protein